MALAAWSGDVRAVFFDAVGTLIHPDPPPAQAYAEVGRRHGSRLGADEIGTRFGRAFRREEERDRRAGLRTDEAREAERWRSIVGNVLDDVADLDSCFAELWDHFARPDHWCVDADTAEVLPHLERAGYRLGLASNFDGRLRRVIAGLPGLAALTDVVVSSEVGWKKPAAGFFAAVCATAGLPPDQIVLVGDDLANDYEGATAAGLRAVLLGPAEPDRPSAAHRIGRLTELLGPGWG